jgi:hypothetical protein
MSVLLHTVFSRNCDKSRSSQVKQFIYFSGRRILVIPVKGQSHEKVYVFFTWDGSFSLRFPYSFKNFEIGRLEAMIFQTWGLSM